MSQPHSLSDQQVEQELRKMTAFIKQEAMEKAREIEIKANEEFAIEKSKLVRQETDSIDRLYEKKYKQAAMSQQITRSTVANKMRLRILSSRQEMLDDIFGSAEKRLHEGTQDAGKYENTLKNLILEGFYALCEAEMQIRVRAADLDIARRALDAASNEYQETTGNHVKASIIESDPLAEGSSGGVIILGAAGKIDINNTFEARLGLLQESALPAIRETLFGKNPNRKFYD